MALLKVLLLLLLGVSVNSAVSLQKRIIGGQNCKNNERLYHVRLESSRGTEIIRCGGSLIHPEWILTAARCWQSEPGWTLEVKLKVHPRTAGQQRQVIQNAPLIYTHFGKKHDLMLLKLQTPVTGVTPAGLPDCRNRLKVGDVVELAGEGATTTGPNYQRLKDAGVAAYLQCVDINIVSVGTVMPVFGNVFTASAPNKDICYGDDGGAAVHNNMVYGVISHGGQNACHTPVIIMDVCDYLGWIKVTTGLLYT